MQLIPPHEAEIVAATAQRQAPHCAPMWSRAARPSEQPLLQPPAHLRKDASEIDCGLRLSATVDGPSFYFYLSPYEKLLTDDTFRNTLCQMNKLNTNLRAQILRSLTEGMGIRPAARLFNVRPHTVMNLMVAAGELCAKLHDKHVRGLHSNNVQMDEMWSVVGAKRHKCDDAMKAKGWGDAWSWFAICATSRLVISYLVGDRKTHSAEEISNDLRERIATNDVQINTDQLKSYGPAIRQAFADAAHHAQITKVFGRQDMSYDGRFSPSVMKGVEKEVVCGAPDMAKASTSYCERFNLSMRMQNRRYTRCCNGHSKKIENLNHSVALSTWVYNFCRPHASLGGATPAMVAGIASRKMTLEELVNAL
jgi:transposase-like protein